MKRAQTGEKSWRRRLVGRVQTRLWLFSALVLLLVAAYVIIGRQLMVMVPEFRGQLEARIVERLGTPVTVGHLRGHMDGLSPVFVLEQVRLPAPDGESPLTIGHVAFTLDLLPSLVQRRVRLRELRIRDVALDLERDKEGRFSVRGLPAASPDEQSKAPSLDALLDLLYRQNRVVLDQISLNLDWAGLPSFQTRDLEAVLVNSGNRHKLSAHLRTAEGRREMELRVSLQGDAYKRADVTGDVYARLRGPGWDRWVEPAWPWPLKPETLDGEVAIWGSFRNGEPESAVLRVALERLELLDMESGQRWPITGGFGLARVDRAQEGYLLSLSDLTLATPEGEWRAGEAGLWWNGRRDQDLGWRVLMRRFNVRTSRNQFVAMPFALPGRLDGLRKQLTELQPRGKVDALFAAGGRERITAINGRVRDLGNDARDRIPGVSGLSGWFSGNAETGVAHLDSPGLSLNMPRLYKHPLVFGISGPFRWHWRDEALMVESGRVRAGNEDARGDALMGVRIAPEQKPELRLLAELQSGDGAAVPDYVPGNKLKGGLADWLKNAFSEGRVPEARFLYQGPVKIDPARQQDRTFQMGFRVRNFRLHYLDDWPDITGLNGYVQLDGRRVLGRGLSGRLLETRFDRLGFDVPAVLPGQQPQLMISGHLQGPAADLSRVFSETPLHDKLPGELDNWRFSEGSLDGHLVMDWPLGEGSKEPKLMASGGLSEATLVSESRNLNVTALNGAFSYDLQGGVQMPALKGRLFGEPVSGSVVTRAAVTRVALAGGIGIKSLRDWLDAGWLSPASGSLDYQAELELPWEQGTVTLEVNSPLEGVSLALPAPLGKQSQERRVTRVTWRNTTPEPELSFGYGESLSGLLYLGEAGIARGHVVAGRGEPGSANEPGILVTGSVDRLSVAPWVDFFRGGSGEGGDWPLRKMLLRIGELDIYGVTVARSHVTLVPAGQDWDLELDSETLAGSLRVPAGYEQRGQQPLSVDVDRMNITLPETAEDEEPVSPLDVPVARVKLSNTVINGTAYGSWQTRIEAIPGGVEFSSLVGDWRRTRFNGRLEWVEDEEGQASRFVGSLQSDDLEKTLRAWDLDSIMQSEKARAVADLSWPGSPFDLEYTQMNGTLSVDIGKGRIPETSRSASALRVLGIFNISSITRRFKLDFTDLYKKGLSFDSITGDFDIEGPVVATRNLVIKSPSAEFRIRGRMNIQAETLDHYMEVTLPVSSNLYAGCLAGPAACAGIFVFERLWGNELEKMATLGYRVTGTWDDPKVKEAENGAGKKK